MLTPPPRRGPRPLLLHLNLALMQRMLATGMPVPPPGQAPTRSDAASETPSSTASPSWNAGWPRSSGGQREAARIATSLAAAGHRPEALREAVRARLAREDRALLAGINAYRRHPARRGLPEPPVIWAEGSTRLLDYGTTKPGANPDAPAVLFVPSLVNRAYVLDLLPGHSLLRHLAGQGLRPLLLDWGWPGAVERGFGLTEYVAGRLEAALAAAGPAPVSLVGYCMGGLLALAAALRRPERVRALALLATPWDFHAGADAATLARALPLLEPVLAATGTLPVDAVQALFALLDPWNIQRKFRGFGRLDQDSERARLFVGLEDWLNDGVPLAAPVARETLGGWYGENRPARGTWRIAGSVVRPDALRVPSFVALPARDRIVPPAAAEALAAALPGAVRHAAQAGHIGMAVGSNAEAALWRPLAEWLRGH